MIIQEIITKNFFKCTKKITLRNSKDQHYSRLLDFAEGYKKLRCETMEGFIHTVICFQCTLPSYNKQGLLRGQKILKLLNFKTVNLETPP